jgi:hypothetical protein
MSNNHYTNRKIDFPVIPRLEWYEAENWAENDLGLVVYKAKNTEASVGVVAEKFYRVDSNKNHILFPANEVFISSTALIDNPNGYSLYVDDSTNSTYYWNEGSQSWVLIFCNKAVGICS